MEWKRHKAEERLGLERSAVGTSRPEDADTRVPIPSPAHSPTTSLELTSENRPEQSDSEVDPRKIYRAQGGKVIEMYAPKRVVLSSDSIVSRAPSAA